MKIERQTQTNEASLFGEAVSSVISYHVCSSNEFGQLTINLQ